MAKLTKEQVEQLKAKHADVELTRLVAAGVEVVVRSPTRAQFKRFIATGRNQDNRLEAAEDLCRDCVVYPDGAELAQVFEKKPALASVLAGEIAEIAGAVEEVEKNAL